MGSRFAKHKPEKLPRGPKEVEGPTDLLSVQRAIETFFKDPNRAINIWSLWGQP